MYKSKKGFTLIELMVVLAILGILSAIAIPKYTQVQKEAKLKADFASARSIMEAARLELLLDGTVGGESSSKNFAKNIDELNFIYLDESPIPQSNFKGNNGKNYFILHYEPSLSEPFIVYFYTNDDTYKVTQTTAKPVSYDKKTP